MNKQNQGITLVALVVTIIVLLILAGVTIAMVLGQDGIFKKAQTARTKTIESQEAEVIKLAMNTIRTNDWENKIRKKELVTAEELKKEIESGGEYTVEVNGESNLTVKYTNLGSSGNTYLVTQEGKVTKQEKTVTIAEKFDRNGEDETAGGYDPTKLHIGDFVTYDAGTWTEEEIKAIKTGLNTDLQQANNSTSSPNRFQFGGFTAGSSKNANAVPGKTTYNYIKEQTNQGEKEVTGWRVFDVNEATGEVILISAGCPENYYFSDKNIEFCRPNSYVLIGKISSNWKKEDGTQMDEQTAQSLYTKRNWNNYINQQQGAMSARVLEHEDLMKWYTRNKGYAIPNLIDDEIFQSVYGKKYETLIDNYAYYWGPSKDEVYMNYTMPISRDFGRRGDIVCGLRILVTIPSRNKIKDNPVGTKTIIDPRDSSNSWTYNVWELL